VPRCPQQDLKLDLALFGSKTVGAHRCPVDLVDRIDDLGETAEQALTPQLLAL
jgi:hypothetical protein